MMDNNGRCPEGYFQCQRGHCIVNVNVVCDGYDHCGDNYDEAHCHDNPTSIPSPDDPFDCNDCQNDGTCISFMDICSCPHGYYGRYCEFKEVPHGCEECQNGATCFTDSNGRSTCVCPPGYYGDNCEHKEEKRCEGCENGGECSDPYDGECTCPDGYYGLKCEHKEDPDDHYCGGCENNGECRSDGYCVCKDPYYGPHCEYYEPECGGGCLNGGECYYGYCQCNYGYYGHRCQYPPDYHELPYSDNVTRLSGLAIGMIAFSGALFIVFLVMLTCCVRQYCCKKTPAKVAKKTSVIKPYTVSAELKCSVSLPPSYDDCHDNPTYDTANPDNVSLPPSYDDIGNYDNNADLEGKQQQQRDVEKA
ncbi:uncharacterized protein LOC144433625 [Glandiceps talaboti]